MADEVLSFDSVLKEQQTQLVKSNFTNLASAYVYMDEAIGRYQLEIDKCRAIQLEIKEMGNKDPATLHNDTIKALYEKARKARF